MLAVHTRRVNGDEGRVARRVARLNQARTRAALGRAIEPLEDRLLLATFAHINFQLPGNTVYPGYLVDSGLAFGDRGNGFSYGWMTAPSGTPVPTNDPSSRDRGSANAPDKRFDTLVHFHKDGQSPVAEANKVTNPTWWQINVPNGTYQIRVVAGDPSNNDETFVMYAQASKTANGVPIVNDLNNPTPGFTGTLLFNKVAAAGDYFADSGVVDVTVTDGKLIISEAANAANNKICFIDIDTQIANPLPSNPTNLQITSTAASKIGLSWTDTSSNENGFRVESSPNGTTWTTVTTLPPNSNSFTATGLAPQTHYYFRVFAFNTTGDSAAPTNAVDTTTSTATGSVSGIFQSATAGDVNLTAEGTLDWAHWALTDANSYNHKNIATPMISDVTPLPGSPRAQGTISTQTFTWSDGTPSAAAAATPNDLGTFGFFHGFTFTVPADTTPRVLRVYVGVRNFRGQLVARLSDGSAADAVNSSLFSTAGADTGGVYTIPYRAGSAGQTLSVTWQVLPPDGDVTDANARIYLKAAALQPAPPPPTGNITSLAASSLNSGRTNLSWTDQATNEIGYNIERAPDNAGTPGTFTNIGTTTGLGFLDATTTPGTKYYYRVKPYNFGGEGPASNQVSIVTPSGTFGTGAQANFFDQAVATPVSKSPPLGPVWPVTAVHPTINFDWGNGIPTGATGNFGPNGAAFGPDQFAVVYTFKLKPEFTDLYTFYMDTDDGYKLVVNGQTLLDGMDIRRGLGTRTASTPIQLTAGQDVSVVASMIEDGGGAGIRLFWSNSQLPQEIVPQAVMYPEPADTVPPTVSNLAVDGHISTPSAYTPAFHFNVVFSENVASVDETDFEVVTPNGTIDSSLFDVTYDPASRTAIFTFPLFTNGQLDDGNYSLTIKDNAISDTFGNPLDGDNNGQAGGAAAIPFYVLNGDTQTAFNGTPKKDRIVDFVDYQIMARNFGMTNPSAADGDFTHDGVVDYADFLYLFGTPGNPGRFGQTLAGPAAPVSAPAPAPAPSRPAPKPAPKLAPKPPVILTKPKAPAKFAGRRITDLLA
jgi:fibronectin type 3 domain-containing protein